MFEPEAVEFVGGGVLGAGMQEEEALADDPAPLQLPP